MCRRSSSLFMAALVLPLLAFPTAVNARAGGGHSMGSRGSHTWSAPRSTSITPYSARPMERSYTPRTESPAPTPPTRSYGAPMAGAGMAGAGMASRGMSRPSLAARHPFMTGFAGGLLGAGLFGLLSGHGFFGGFTGGTSFLGFLFQALLVAGFIMLVMKLWRRPTQSQNAQNPSNGGTTGMGRSVPEQRPVTLTPADYQEFQKLLLNIQAAWSAENIDALRRMTTPEMASYFNEQLSELSSRGARNVLSDVRFISGDLSEAWREGNLTYATVAMRFSMIDVTTDSLGHVIEGNPDQPEIVTELWTFVRLEGRGNWVLSAIQQAS